MKIGMWLLNRETYTDERFEEVMEQIKNSDIDLFIFPGSAYYPFVKGESPLEDVMVEMKKLVARIGKSMIFSGCMILENKEAYVNFYLDSTTLENEFLPYYIKHIGAEYSLLEEEDYIKDSSPSYFPYFSLNEQKIGMTISEDISLPLFNRFYDYIESGIDILINTDKGNRNYNQCYRYNQVRAIENHCFTFCVMGWRKDSKKNSYVFGFDRDGNEMSFTNLTDPSTTKCNLLDSIYVYDTENYQILPRTIKTLPASFIKSANFKIEVGNTAKRLSNYTGEYIQYREYYRNKTDKVTGVFTFIEGDEILYPEYVSYFLYCSQWLKKEVNKRYIIVNHWDNLDPEFFENTLDAVLRVRAEENNCIVVLESDSINRCYQCNKNDVSQEIKAHPKGYFHVDLSFAKGPESIWRDRKGMRAVWRKNYEALAELIFNVSGFADDVDE